MKTKINLKTFTCGLVVGVLAATGVSVSAAVVNAKVEVWLSKDISLNIDGNDVTIPNEYSVLNYQDRIYLPYRFIAEKSGAKVGYDADKRKVIIENPLPIVKEVIVEVEKPGPTIDNRMYSPVPIKLTKKDVSISIEKIEVGTSATYMDFSLINNGGNYVKIDYEKAYMEVDGIKFKTTQTFYNDYSISIAQGEDISNSFKGEFEVVPQDRNKVKLVIPVLFYEYKKGEGFTEVNYDFEYLLDLTETD